MAKRLTTSEKIRRFYSTLSPDQQAKAYNLWTALRGPDVEDPGESVKGATTAVIRHALGIKTGLYNDMVSNPEAVRKRLSSSEFCHFSGHMMTAFYVLVNDGLVPRDYAEKLGLF